MGLMGDTSVWFLATFGIGRPLISRIQPAEYLSCSNPQAPIDAETISYVATSVNLSALTRAWTL